MSFSIAFGKTDKARNSTKVPAVSGSIPVVLKDNTSIISPTWKIRLGASGAPSFSALSEMNYCYCEEFKRYYFITNVTMETATIALISCEVDVLATFREDILKTPAFVMFSQSHYNIGIPDTRITAQARSHQTSTLANMAICDGEGVFAITAVSPNNTGDAGVNATVMVSKGGLQSIASKLYAEDFWSEIQVNLYRPEEALIGCMWTPISDSVAMGEGSTQIKIGNFDLGTWYNCKRKVEGTTFVTLYLHYGDNDPMQGINSDFRNFAPYSRYFMFLPGVGEIEIPLTLLGGTAVTNDHEIQIPVRMTASPLTGDVAYRICYPSVKNGIGGQSVAMIVKGNFGVEVPIARSVGKYGSAVQTVTGVLSGAVKGATSGATAGIYGAIGGGILGGVAGGAGSMIGNAIGGESFDTTMGSMLNGWSVSDAHNRQIETTTVSYDLSDNPANLAQTIGRPYYKNVSALGNVSGFCQCTGAHVKTWGTSEELRMITNFVNGGEGGIIIE